MDTKEPLRIEVRIILEDDAYIVVESLNHAVVMGQVEAFLLQHVGMGPAAKSVHDKLVATVSELEALKQHASRERGPEDV
jgi:hypothetical protein